jgi:1,4-alpha-glucan branching enzyme
LLTFIRKAKNSSDYLLFILNFTPNTHSGYKIGVPEAREYRIILNSDSSFYGGSNVGDTTVMGMDGSWQSQGCHAIVRIPPLAGMILKPV